jgi:hypothetical protein
MPRCTAFAQKGQPAVVLARETLSVPGSWAWRGGKRVGEKGIVPVAVTKDALLAHEPLLLATLDAAKSVGSECAAPVEVKSAETEREAQALAEFLRTKKAHQTNGSFELFSQGDSLTLHPRVLAMVQEPNVLATVVPGQKETAFHLHGAHVPDSVLFGSRRIEDVSYSREFEGIQRARLARAKEASAYLAALERAAACPDEEGQYDVLKAWLRYKLEITMSRMHRSESGKPTLEYVPYHGQLLGAEDLGSTRFAGDAREQDCLRDMSLAHRYVYQRGEAKPGQLTLAEDRCSLSIPTTSGRARVVAIDDTTRFLALLELYATKSNYMRRDATQLVDMPAQTDYAVETPIPGGRCTTHYHNRLYALTQTPEGETALVRYVVDQEKARHPELKFDLDKQPACKHFKLLAPSAAQVAALSVEVEKPAVRPGL